MTEIPTFSEHDVAVVGGGAAGLSAALVLARARRSVVVVDAGHPRNAPAAHMQGFLSRDGLPPAELLAIGRAEVASYGGQVVSGHVEDVAPLDGGFVLTVSGGRTVRARRVLVATGLRDELPDVPGVRERFGRDVLHCPYCHGWEVRDQRLAVLGGTPGAAEHALLLRQWSDRVVYVPHVDEVTGDDRRRLAARGVDVVEGPVARVAVTDDRVEGIALADGRTVACDAVFVRPRFVPHDRLLRDLGCAVDELGWVSADATGRTSVPGVWVAGNAANARAQVITAAGEGSAAAIAINNDLVLEETS